MHLTLCGAAGPLAIKAAVLWLVEQICVSGISRLYEGPVDTPAKVCARALTPLVVGLQGRQHWPCRKVCWIRTNQKTSSVRARAGAVCAGHGGRAGCAARCLVLLDAPPAALAPAVPPRALHPPQARRGGGPCMHGLCHAWAVSCVGYVTS